MPCTANVADGEVVPTPRLVPLNTKADESMNEPPVEMYGTRPEVSEETVRFVEDAVPKYPVPETVNAVEEAYGNCEAVDVVAVKYPAMA